MQAKPTLDHVTKNSFSLDNCYYLFFAECSFAKAVAGLVSIESLNADLVAELKADTRLNYIGVKLTAEFVKCLEPPISRLRASAYYDHSYYICCHTYNEEAVVEYTLRYG